jgi:hypothetical protein
MGCGAVVTGGTVVVPLRKRDVIALLAIVIAVTALPVTSRTNLRIVLRHDISAILYDIIKIKYILNC